MNNDRNRQNPEVALNSPPLIILSVGWMDNYDSMVSEIEGGGEYVEMNNRGSEMLNFKNDNGYCYGYSISSKFAGINVARIMSDKKFLDEDYLDGVTVVFIAHNKHANNSRASGLKKFVVGWYKNARVFHRQYKYNEIDDRDYHCETLSENAFLVPVEKRDHAVPFQEKGFPGHSAVWYNDKKDNQEVVEMVRELRAYMEKMEGELAPVGAGKRVFRTAGSGSLRAAAPDKDLLLQIEANAVNAVVELYERRGYFVKSVERENVGWDLEAQKPGEMLRLEVKGHRGSQIAFELTPNEYANLIEHHETYRVCVLRRALEEDSEVEVYEPFCAGQDDWRLRLEGGSSVLELSKKVAAVAYELTGGEET